MRKARFACGSGCAVALDDALENALCAPTCFRSSCMIAGRRERWRLLDFVRADSRRRSPSPSSSSWPNQLSGFKADVSIVLGEAEAEEAK